MKLKEFVAAGQEILEKFGDIPLFAKEDSGKTLAAYYMQVQRQTDGQRVIVMCIDGGYMIDKAVPELVVKTDTAIARYNGMQVGTKGGGGYRLYKEDKNEIKRSSLSEDDEDERPAQKQPRARGRAQLDLDEIDNYKPLKRAKLSL